MTDLRRLLGGEDGLMGKQSSAALEQLVMLRDRLGWSLSFRVLEKLFVTLSGPNKLDFGRWMMVKTDKQKYCGFHPSFSSFFLPTSLPVALQF